MKQNNIHKKTYFLKLLLLSVSLIAAVTVSAQKKGKNLVPNPGFEKHKNKSNEITNAVPWRNVGTVDYYMKPDKKDTSKYRGAHTGTCYSGLRFQSEYKEFMYVALTETLQKGKTYKFKMYVRLLGESTVTVKQLGVYFSDEVFKKEMSFDKESIIDSTFKKGLKGDYNWIPIHGDYVARGGEKYIIIGNFNPKVKEDFVRKNKWDIFEFKEAYYFLDDISLRRVITATDSIDISKTIENEFALSLPDSFSTGQHFIITNLKFDTKSAVLSKASGEILDELVRVLNEHPFMEIQINGFTDNEGLESANKSLSKKRAKAVYSYLLAHGVINPMTYKGLGALQPIAPNDMEENKAKNRRVEFVITKE